MRRSVLRCFLTMMVLTITIGADATITVVSHYQLGEADPGAADGVTGADPTIDSVGAFNLARADAPVYSSDVPIPTTTFTTLSMLFDGANDRYSAAVIPVAATDNFGIEAWVRSNGDTTGNAVVAYVGNTSSSGWGIFRAAGSYAFLYGGVTLTSVTPVTTDWTHLALVRDGGVTRFYVNGQLALTSAAVPNLPAGSTMIAGNPLNGVEFFDGRIDDVRVFTFNAGEFRTTDLNFAWPPIPATSTLAKIALVSLIALAGFVVIRRVL